MHCWAEDAQPHVELQMISLRIGVRHCAGTELMIGPLFVAAGVSVFDVLGGLFIGNIVGGVQLGVSLCADRGACPSYALLPVGGNLRSSIIHALLDNGVITLFLQSDIHRFRYASKENPAGNPAPTLVLELAPSR
jgi:hypothetical protein